MKLAWKEKAELLSLFFAVGLVLFIAVFSYRAWSAFSLHSEQVAITRQIVDGTNALLSSIKDAETGQRGFLLTGEDRYLEAYRRGTAETPGALNVLTNATATQPDQAQRVETLKPLVTNKLDELQETVRLRQSYGLDVALVVVQRGRGEALSEQIRQWCGIIQTVAYGRLAKYSEQSRSSANQLGFISTLGSIGLFVLLISSTASIQRGTRRRKQLIERLQKSEAKTREARDWLQTTMASIADGVIASDATGRVTFLNPVAELLTGWLQEQARGMPLDQVFVIQNEETGEAVENPVGKALSEGRVGGLENHTQLRSRDGRNIPIDDSAAPIVDARGNTIGVVLVFREITEKREAERLEKEARAELARHAELLERTNAELQQFAYAASHDLREPLRTISIYTELVQVESGTELNEKSAEYLRFIASGARRMGKLIDALLEYSRAGEITDKPVRLLQMDQIVKTALANLNGSIEESKATITHDRLPTIMGNEVHVGQVIQNLIGNALKYRGQEAPRVHIAAWEQRDSWRFSIADNGQGIAPPYQTQIFKLFNRLHGQDYPGSGIGLATCKKIIERYGGRIWVESEVGKGSTFFFTIPHATEFHQSASGGH
jgi:PAS domain S-box-containing protein